MMTSQQGATRNDIAASVLLEFLPDLSLGTKILLVENYSLILSKEFTQQDLSYSTWNRQWSTEVQPRTWPQGKDYDTIIIRLPKSHEAFDMILHAVSSVINDGSNIIVYGLNDEGIKGAQKKMSAFFGNNEVCGYKKRVRLISSTITTKKEMKIKNSLTDFTSTSLLSYIPIDTKTPLSFKMIFYPGMFASGQLDDGTKLLLNTIFSSIQKSSDILDYGCGSGIIARIVHTLHPTAKIVLLDKDIISLKAAKDNFPKYEGVILADSLAGCKEKKYDLIISNPPIHTEKEEHYRTLHQLITDAPQYLNEGGKIVLVAQSRINLEEHFINAGMTPHILAEDSRFKVWRGIIND